MTYKFSNKMPYANFILILLILSFFFASCVNTGYITDFEEPQKILGKISRGYLIDSELNSFKFYLKNSNLNRVVSDYVSSRYLGCYTKNSTYSLNALNYGLNGHNTYLIFRDSEYRSSDVLFFSLEGKLGLGFGERNTRPLKFSENPNPSIYWAKGLKVYNSNSVTTYLRNYY